MTARVMMPRLPSLPKATCFGSMPIETRGMAMLCSMTPLGVTRVTFSTMSSMLP